MANKKFEIGGFFMEKLQIRNSEVQTIDSRKVAEMLEMHHADIRFKYAMLLKKECGLQ